MTNIFIIFKRPRKQPEHIGPFATYADATTHGHDLQWLYPTGVFSLERLSPPLPVLGAQRARAARAA